MARLFLILGLCCLFSSARADHITGGEMFYTYLGKVNGNNQYRITLKLFMRCNSGRQFNDPTIVSVFDRTTNERIHNLTVPLTGQDFLSLTNNNPCITNPPVVCYNVGLYDFNVSLPDNVNGYLLASQVNFRIAGISNLENGYSQIGATYTCEIPGTSNGTAAPANNSARFTGSDLVIVCANNSFSYSFAASDPDGDQLSYHFCGAYRSTNAGQVNAPFPPPFEYVPYGQGYGESAPLGANVVVNQETGMITGTAPSSGVYVVTVCVEERRNGIVIATQRKDLQISITECSIAAANLLPEYFLCKEQTSVSINNLSTSPLITSYSWRISSFTGNSLYTTNDQVLNYNFSDTGLYYVTLHINKNQICPDSSTSLIRVYPGLKPGFYSIGECFTKPTSFFDTSKLIYGTINSWKWEFNDPLGNNDVSTQKDPVYTYLQNGPKNVQLIVTTTKGCRDTLTKQINIIDKPTLSVASKDTLICKGDSIMLQAIGNGIFSWTPGQNILQGDTKTPVVFPLTTTKYYVSLNDNGCLNKDSVNVRVVDFVSLSMKADTIICATDTITLNANTDALHFSWSPPANIEDPQKLITRAFVASNTVFQLTASIGHCTVTGNYSVQTVPYPEVNAGEDKTICFGNEALLEGSTNGIIYSWSPVSTLSDPNSLTTIAKPKLTQSYVLTAFDNKGCPKPARDTAIVIVMPEVLAFAGNDTSVIVGQPLQLKATGGVQYVWKPADYLSSPSIADPIAQFNPNVEGMRYIVYVYDAEGCSDSATIDIRIFTTPPVVFVPSAFTPNNDGKNDILRPIAVGMTNIEYFRVFNRWGQLLFSTTRNEHGWDGRINGREQKTDQFVWEVKATDFKGNVYFQKGTTTLIR